MKSVSTGPQFACTVCGAKFGRAEHLNRHALSHSNTKPFTCTVCFKSFTRRDTLSRHVSVHSASETGKEGAASRVSHACDNCARLRLRCDGQPTCARCQSKSLQCVYSARTRRRVAVVPNASPGKSTAGGSAGDSPDVSVITTSTTSTPNTTTADHPESNSPAHGVSGFPVPTTTSLVDRTVAPLINVGTMGGNPLSPRKLQFDNDFAMDWSWDEDASLVDWMNFGNGFNDNILSFFAQPPADLDYSYTKNDDLVQPNAAQQQGFESSHTATTPISSKPQHANTNADQWPTDWNPSGLDNLLSFPDMSSASVDIVEAENFAHVDPLTQQAYDDIGLCSKENDSTQSHFRPFQNATLPPLQVMDCFLQLYFEYFHPIFPMLHQATFESYKAPWQLSLALCAIGSRYSKLSSSSQCSDALQELLRRAISGSIEKDNSIVRELWVTQAMILNYTGMTYSGNKRFFEISEAFRGGPAIQCRRLGSLKPTTNPISVSSKCSGQELETIWKAWIADESRRRLGFSCFLMDAQNFLYLNANPFLTVLELQQQLPCSEDIWDAPTAETWKEMFLKCTATVVPTVPQTMETLRQGDSLPPTIGDFARLVLVFVTYAEVAAIQKSRTNLLLRDPRLVDRIIEEGNRVGVQILENLRDAARHDSDFPMRSSLNCHIHLTMMLLFTPRTEVINYAQSFIAEPKVGTTRPRLREWIEYDAGRQARQATAAAGALTGLLQSNSTLGFYEPIAAVLATLTMWTYSQMVQQSPFDGGFGEIGSIGMASNDRRPSVKLDDFCEAARICEWVEGLDGLRAHIKDAGSIYGSGAGSRILAMGRDLVAGRSAWLLSHGFSVWLDKLKTRADKYDSFGID